MWFESVEVRGVGPIRHVKVDAIPRGVVGVFAPNGGGKSTFFGLLKALLTNDFTFYDGTREQLVSDLVPIDTRAFVRGVLRHGETRMTLTRSLRPAGSQLDIDGEKRTITGVAEIADRLRTHLGITPKAVDMLFQPQNQLTRILDTRDAERRDMFQSLCGTESCIVVHELLGNWLNTDPELAAGQEEQTDLLDLEAEASRLAETILSLDQDLEKARAKKLNEASFNSANALRRRAAELEYATREIAVKQQALTTSRGTWEEAKRVLATGKSQVQNAVGLRDRLRPQADKARQQLRGLESRQRRLEQRDKVARDLARCQEAHRKASRALSELGEVTDLQRQHEEAMQVRAVLEADLQKVRDLVTAAEEGGVGKGSTCLFCFQKLPPAKAKQHLETHRQRVTQLEADVLLAEQEAGRLGQARVLAVAAQSRVSETQQAVHRAQAKLDGLSGPDDADETLLAGSESDLKLIVAKYERYENEVTSRTSLLAGAARAEAAGEREVLNAEAEIRRLQVLIDKGPVPVTRLQRAEQRLREHNQALQDEAVALATLSSHRVNAATLGHRIDGIKQRLERGRVKREMADIVRAARRQVHRTGLPAEVARANLRRIAKSINANLRLFGRKFWVEVDDKLTFIAHKPGEKPRRAGQLSVGQRYVLGVSFWLALSLLWGKDLGLLGLDEPTANLDQLNRSYLADALAHMGGKCRGRRQVFVSSHDPEIRRALDLAIDLDAAG